MTEPYRAPLLERLDHRREGRDDRDMSHWPSLLQRGAFKQRIKVSSKRPEERYTMTT
jgi:hypothetical protein